MELVASESGHGTTLGWRPYFYWRKVAVSRKLFSHVNPVIMKDISWVIYYLEMVGFFFSFFFCLWRCLFSTIGESMNRIGRFFKTNYWAIPSVPSLVIIGKSKHLLLNPLSNTKEQNNFHPEKCQHPLPSSSRSVSTPSLPISVKFFLILDIFPV